ncbi:MAG: hypothetical protein ACFHWZ_18500 [Phycisphaerales bacterium]
MLYAFATMFAAFHWIMTLDFHWFSTMYGVYFFAGNLVSALALLTAIFIALRFFGKLNGAFTDEHLHDMSKFVFGFTVFWAYISFSQYFLIWYANIPEETAYFTMRRDEWTALSFLLPIGHFIVPFLVLLPRRAPQRRTGVRHVLLDGVHAHRRCVLEHPPRSEDGSPRLLVARRRGCSRPGADLRRPARPQDREPAAYPAARPAHHRSPFAQELRLTPARSERR